MRSSPGPKTGCSEDRVTRTRPDAPTLRSSPGPKTGCSTKHPELTRLPYRVAILTRSEDRVQPTSSPRMWGSDTVAILTRSEDRVQLANSSGGAGTVTVLRSSPGPKTGCSSSPNRLTARVAGVAILTRSEDRVQPSVIGAPAPLPPALRSSPGPKTGCSAYIWIIGGEEAALRSSPGPKTGCSVKQHEDMTLRHDVAILTRSEDRVQHGIESACQTTGGVAILTRSEDRVQLSGRQLRGAPGYRCDPHPVRRPGAASAPCRWP